MASGGAQAATYSIPAESIDIQKVYYGAADGFEKAGKVNYEAVIKATPEYAELKKKKIKPGTGRYWILLSKASERAVRAIGEVGNETEYDFIAANEYLSTFESTIPSEDITKLVLEKLGKGESKAREKE